MKNNLTKPLMAIMLLLLATNGLAQNGFNSPYTRYGFGILNDRSNGFNKGMAGVGIGMREGTQINSQNPASYSAVDSLSFLFDIGVSFQNANFSLDGKKKNAHNTSLDYLNVAFRAWRRVGISLGLQPFSSIGYKFSGTETLPDLDGFGERTATTQYSGDGGLHEAYLGIGWEAFKNFSIGMNAAYLWGDYSHTAQVSFSETSVHPLLRNYSANISNYKLDFGVQYSRLVSKNDLIVVGATYGLGHSINNKAKFINQILTSSGTISSADTISTPNAFELPHSFGVGAMWNHRDRWRVGLDYSLELWNNVKFPKLNDENGSLSYKSTKGSFDDRHHVSLGAEYLPNNIGIHYRDHIRYRAGISYSTAYTKVNGKSGADNYLVSLGVGLPIANIHNNRSTLNVALQWEHVRPRTSGMLTENYLRFSIGLSFNESWFMKWKVE